MVNSEYKKIYLVITILMIISTLFGGTLAYWQWSTDETNKTHIAFTVESTFMCSADGGGNITQADAFIAPTDCTNSDYAIKRKITVSPVLYEVSSITMNLWLDINSIGTGLSDSDNFKYALTTDSNSCTNGLIKTGNFKGKTTGDRAELFNYKEYNISTTDTFYLYIWLDKEETSATTMNQSSDISLNGICENRPEPKGEMIYNLVESYAVPDNKVSQYVSNSQGIDFGIASGDENGKGVYTLASTINDNYPVHYYRGEVNNNNVIFANFCWKIVRTTETGGTKLIYNGPASNGKCNNTGSSTQIGSKIAFGPNNKLESSGYAYGPTHSLHYEAAASIEDGVVFANNVTYENGEYIYIVMIYI